MGRHKYGAQPTTVDGIKFDSKKEANRYGELKLLEKAGEIRNLKLQPRFNLVVGSRPVLYESGRQAYYKADFMYWDERKSIVTIEDVKGMDTPASKLKRAMVTAQLGVKIVLI